ncbi:hypothetical protein HAP48_0042395 [Bradyrhizobium septentrionale]|uniref:Uncharacterized protein n=1 Tax=Bradyrhizobium septentrionale TaxID=1404411 RepID=A0A974A1J4_9BRAD|nr:hypothetical protein [Bradyrhizobium septentrionale]UGY15109.1 hypothetical protein HAP48_0042395 [Bradyrhizobium septentrionale]UGY23714.1 hypothetical protein HU675_0038175 [Bradyrhizobium septentrionale]
MAISPNILAELAFLQAQVDAANPLASASRATLTAIKLNAAQLVSDIQDALVAPSILDTFVAPVDGTSIVQGILTVSQAAIDQNRLSLMRGLTGRAAANLNQVPS